VWLTRFGTVASTIPDHLTRSTSNLLLAIYGCTSPLSLFLHSICVDTRVLISIPNTKNSHGFSKDTRSSTVTLTRLESYCKTETSVSLKLENDSSPNRISTMQITDVCNYEQFGTPLLFMHLAS
jgi:hypothetical protein